MSKHIRLFNKVGDPAAAADSSWFRIRNAAPDDPVAPIEIDLYGEIGGFGISAADFIRDLRAADDGARPVMISISSNGGDVFEGIAIHNALRRLGDRCTARIDAVAASIASVVAVGAHRLVMPDNAMLMIHNPWGGAVGEADDMRQAADLMDKAKDLLIACYRAKAPALTVDELSALMSDTTWLSAAEAAAMGLVDEVISGVQIQASARLYAALGHCKGVPATLLAALRPADPPPADKDTPPVAERGGLTLTLAGLAASLCREAGLSVVAVERVTQASALRDEAAVRAAVQSAVAIRDLAKVAKLEAMTDQLLMAGLDVDAARARLFDRVVQRAGDEIDAHIRDEPQETRPAAKGPNAAKLYASRRAGSQRETIIRGK